MTNPVTKEKSFDEYSVRTKLGKTKKKTCGEKEGKELTTTTNNYV